MHHFLFIIHLLSATIWVGGHLLLSIAYLPPALKSKDPEVIRGFEKKYEPIGIPALIILVVTGVMMAYRYGVSVSTWFRFESQIESVVSIKLLLLFTTFALAVHARFFIIPKLSTKTLGKMALHIILITIIGISMLILGSTVRLGGI